MGGENATVAMHERQFGAADLPQLRLAAKLVDGLDGVEHAAGRARMPVGQQAAGVLHGSAPPRPSWPSSAAGPASPRAKKPMDSSSTSRVMVKES